MSSEVKPPAPAKPPRSPVERAIVWGVIGVGLLVIAVEANAHLAHAAALGKLRAKLDETVNVDTGVTKKHVDEIVGNKIPETQKLNFLDTAMAASRVDIYTYPALLRSRKLYIYYGIDGKLAVQEAEVMEVLTAVAPTAAEAQAGHPAMDPSAKHAGPGEGVGGPGGPGSGTGGGTGGGRRKNRPNAEDGDSGRPKTEEAATEPASDKPKTDDAKPEETKPEVDKPEPEKPAADKPAETKPEETKPEETKPAETEPKKE